MTGRLTIAILITGGALYAVAAPAQIATTGPAALARAMPRIYGPYMANISRIRVARRAAVAPPRAVAGRPDRPRVAGSARPAPAPALTTFRPTGPPFVPALLAARLADTPREREEIRAILTECLTHYTGNARRNGVPLNDVARAYNYYLATNYYVYSLGRGPSQRQMDATRDGIRADLAGDPAFRRMTDRQKQEAYETLIVLAGFVDSGYGTMRAKGNAAGAEQFREMARQNLEALLGVPVGRIRFTDAGLVLD